MLNTFLNIFKLKKKMLWKTKPTDRSPGPGACAGHGWPGERQRCCRRSGRGIRYTCTSVAGRTGPPSHCSDRAAAPPLAWWWWSRRWNWSCPPPPPQQLRPIEWRISGSHCAYPGRGNGPQIEHYCWGQDPLPGQRPGVNSSPERRHHLRGQLLRRFHRQLLSRSDWRNCCCYCCQLAN